MLAVQTPPDRISTVDALMNTPIINGIAPPSQRRRRDHLASLSPARPGRRPGSSQGQQSQQQPQLLSNLSHLHRTVSEAVVSHYNVQPVFEVYADVQGRDLGGVSADVQRVVDSLRSELPRGSTFAIRGQVESMNSSFSGLASGLVFAVLLVYFLMVVNFQSWLDPFIILTALPGALAGIVWMLFLTQTTVSVPALMGAIMCIGVATSNSILLITFANDQRQRGARRPQRRPVGRSDPAAAGADDRAGHDHRHVADVAGSGRRRRAKRPAGPGRHRRPAGGHLLHALLRARDVQPAPPPAAPA